jgi:hypothetical protein
MLTVPKDEATDAAFADPQPGDNFHEMFSFRAFVVARFDDYVIWLTASPPCTIPDDGNLHGGTLAEFRAAFAYGTIPGYSVIYEGRLNASGWLDFLLHQRAGLVSA